MPGNLFDTKLMFKIKVVMAKNVMLTIYSEEREIKFENIYLNMFITLNYGLFKI